MTFEDFEKEFAQALGTNYKTKDVDRWNKALIRRQEDVSCLKPYVLEMQQYHRTYFQVSLMQCTSMDEKFQFIEDNFDLLQDWWHTDQIPVILGNEVEFSYIYQKAEAYIQSSKPFVRRLGYILFIPRLVKDKENIEKLWALLKDDTEYYVIMGEAWLISYLAMCDAEKTYMLMKESNLEYNILGKAIQKICDSYAISQEDKEMFKSLRALKRGQR